MSSASTHHTPSTNNDAPWVQRFRAPNILWTELARFCPTRGLAVTNQSKIYQLYAWDVATGAMSQLTDRPEGKMGGSISPDGRHVYYLDDEHGNEIGHIVRVPFEGGPSEDLTPDLPPYSIAYLGFSSTSKLFGFTAATSGGFKIYCLSLESDQPFESPQLIYQADKIASGPYLSYDGEIGIVQTTARVGSFKFGLLAFDIESGELINELWADSEGSVEIVAFSPIAGDMRLLATTNQSGDKRPLIWNPRSGERIHIPLGNLAGEVTAIDWSLDGSRLLLSHFSNAVQRFYVYDLTTSTLSRLDHPSGTYGFWGVVGVYFGSDNEIFAQWEDSTHPPRLVALDAQTGNQTRTILSVGDVPPSSPWKSITFTSSDGQEIQGWLGLPEGDGPFPTILETHGGPTAAVTESYSPSSQVWLDHGFAYLSINYRGSTTFGREFEEKIRGDLGHWEVEDMVAARSWLVEHEVANPDQILLTGWSYGGYLTLMGLGLYPDLWAGGLAGIAIADWAIQYEDSADTLRGYQVALFDGTPEEKPEQYATSSPIAYAENIKAPVLIIQGRNDTRTPARPIEIYEQKMRSMGKPIEVIWFESGHLGPFADSELSIEHHQKMLEFACRILRHDDVC